MGTSGLNVDNWALCKVLKVLFPHPPGGLPYAHQCFAVEVNPLLGYYACAANGILFLLSGFDGSFTHKYLHWLLHPEDPRPPPDLIECCSCCRCKCKRRTRPAAAINGCVCDQCTVFHTPQMG